MITEPAQQLQVRIPAIQLAQIIFLSIILGWVMAILPVIYILGRG